MTNGEKLREMSDEELALFLCEKQHDCLHCKEIWNCTYNGGKGNGMLKWLKKECDKE